MHWNIVPLISINLDRRSLWLLCMLGLLWLPPAVAALDLPEMGKSADAVLSPQEEEKLGEAFMRKLRESDKLLDDPALDAYLDHLGYRLVAHSDDPAQKFTFFMLDDPTINAFAVPGGYIGINSGLMLHTRVEDELASVLAHEISHVTQRHIARTLEKGGKFSLPAMAAMIAAIAIGIQNPEIGQAVVTSVAAGSIQMQLNFTRQHEREADRVGMRVLADAGFNPRSMPDFFAELQAATRYYGEGPPEFLRSHPVTTDRIAEAKDRAAQYEVHTPTAEDALLFPLMRARLLALTAQDPQATYVQLEKNLASGNYQNLHAVHYAMLLSALETSRFDAAQDHLEWLQAHDEDRVLYRLAQVQLALRREDLAQAVELSRAALKVYPGDKLLGMTYAETLLQNGAAAQAVEVLEAMPSTPLPEYHHLLARSHKAAENSAASLLAMAESYYLRGRTALAIEQLKQAQRITNLDFYMASKIDARLEQLEKIRAEEVKAERDS